MHRFLSLACVLLLTACAGSAYRLPQVNEADVQAMQKKLTEDQPPLKIYERSNKTYEQKLANISSRLKKNAKSLCEHAQYPSCYFKVNYDADDTVNAYASEGYQITLHRGLLQYLKTDDEIAAVVGHEMGHHLANHIQEKQQNAAVGAAVSGILTAVVLGAAGANTYYDPYQQQRNQEAIEDMMAAGAHIGVLSYSKEQEREADLLATYLLSRAGYNLKRAQNIMVVLSKTSGEKTISQSAFLDSHPAGFERVVAWEMAIDEIKHNPSKLPYLKEEPLPSTEEEPKE